MSARMGAPRAGAQPGGLAAQPLNLIHRTNSPNPALARVSSRLGGLDQVADDLQELVDFLKADPSRAVIVAKAIERVESTDAAIKFLLGFYRGGADAKSIR